MSSGRGARPGFQALRSWRFVLLSTGLSTALIGGYVIDGSDSLWLVELGSEIAHSGRIPEGVPFAAADSSNWFNVLVVAELILAGVHSLGAWALPLLHVIATVLGLLLVALTARREGATDGAVGWVVISIVLGSLTSFLVVRLQLFSLVLFPLLLLLLRAEARARSKRIWLLPVLVAVWGNLHGAVLLGVSVAGAYLLLDRLRHRVAETLAVGVASLTSLMLTPAGIHTPDYYRGVFENESAVRGVGLWGHPSLSNPADVIMGVVFVALAGLALSRRLRPWEYAGLAGLVFCTLLAGRNSVWLLMMVAPPAAVGLSSLRRGRERWRGPDTADARRDLIAATGCAAACVVVAGVLVVPRGDDVLPASPAVVSAIDARAGSGVVLAPEPLAEQLAVEGVTVWMANPVDAFSRSDQRAYLDFLDGTGPDLGHAIAQVDVVVVKSDTVTREITKLLEGFDRAALADGWLIYQRR